MINENKSSLYKQGVNLILENKISEAKSFLTEEYRNNPGDIYLVHLLISTHILTNSKHDLIKFLRYEEDVSLFRAKLGFIRNIISKDDVKSLYQIGSSLLTRGWDSDANTYFQLHSTLSPGHDKSLIPLGETAIKNGQFQKGILLLNKAAENYFNNNKYGDIL